MNDPEVYYWSGRHPINESIIKYPPEGYSLRSNMDVSRFDILGEYNKDYELFKQLATKTYNRLNTPRIMWINKKCDLLFTSSGLIPLNHKPWIVGVEYASSFVGFQEERIRSSIMQRKVAKHLSSQYCKKILPFSEACRKSIESAYFPYLDGFSNKMEVVYPAITPYPEVSKDHNNNKIKILFVGGHFFDKGGRELIHAIEILQKKYDIELDMITGAPNHHQENFKILLEKYRYNKNIRIINQNIPRAQLFERYYSNCDIFVLPSYIDLFGYVFLEAMAAGLPLIGTDVFATPEIIEDGKNGFTLHSSLSPFDSDYLRSPQQLYEYRSQIMAGEVPGIVNQLVEKISLLIDDDALRRDMGRVSRGEIIGGKFSIKTQKQKLKRIFDEALD